MKRYIYILIYSIVVTLLTACSSSYKAKPLPFRTPASFDNVAKIGGAEIAAKAFVDPKETKEAFGFDILGAGMLPVQVVFDNQGPHSLEIVGHQTFLEDQKGNLWPVLSSKTAYERASKYAKTKEIFKEGAYTGFLGAAAGSIIGAAIGVVSGDNIAEAVGKGAAMGAAAGATLGGVGGYTSDDVRRSVTSDLRDKSLQNRAVAPQDLAHGFLFFPGEAGSARQLRLRIKETDTGKTHVLKMSF
jgi:hypothetical protein